MPNFSTQVSELAIGTIELRPKMQLRSTYEDTDELAASIRRHGQEQPGRVRIKPDSKGYELYIGMRRYAAVKNLYEEAKTDKERERFAKFYAYVDSDLTDEEMLLRALDENKTGTRKDLTPLEEFLAMRQFDLSKYHLSDYYRRLNALKLTTEQAANLQKIEKNAGGYVFPVGALEFLTAYTNAEGDLCETAAQIAEHRYDRSAKKMEEAFDTREEVFGLPWFTKLFPQLKPSYDDDITGELKGIQRQIKETEGGEGGQQTQPTEPGAEALGPSGRAGAAAGMTESDIQPTRADEPPKKPEAPAFVEENVLLFRCSNCGGPLGYEPSEVAFAGYLISFKKGTDRPVAKTPVEMERKAGDSTMECESCGKTVFYQVKRGEDGKYYVSVNKRLVEIAPAADRPVKPAFMKWDDRAGCWGVLSEDGRTIVRKILAVPKEARKGKQKN